MVSSMRQKMLGIVVLSALAGLPVSGAVCAALCDPSGSTGATGPTGRAMSHGSEASCHETSAPAQLRLGGISEHDCGHHTGNLPEVSATLAMARVHSGVPVLTQASPFGHAIPHSFSVTRTRARSSLPLSPSATSTRLVLRV